MESITSREIDVPMSLYWNKNKLNAQEIDTVYSEKKTQCEDENIANIFDHISAMSMAKVNQTDNIQCD